MYYIKKTMGISAAHSLELDYQSKCGNLHGHNWDITVYCKSEQLDKNGMVVDFSKIKEIVKGRMDHQNLNEVFDFNPTAENIARWVCEHVDHCYRVDVTETQNNTASYEKD